MQQKIDENIFSKGTEKEREKREKRRKQFFLISGVLLIVAVILFLRKSDYVRNQIALLKDDADYYVYVEQKNLKSVNETIAEYYDTLRKEHKESGMLHTTKQIKGQMEAKALLATLLNSKGIDTEAEMELSATRLGGQFALTGEVFASGFAYPLEALYDGAGSCYFYWPLTGNYYYLTLPQAEAGYSTEQLLANGSLTGSKLKKLLAEYEKLFFATLSKEDVVMTDHVLRSVNEHAAYQKELALSIRTEKLKEALTAVFSALSKDKTVSEIYEDGRIESAPEYDVYLGKLQEKLLAEDGMLGSLTSLDMKVYVDNYGRITGRDIVLLTKADSYRIGYATVTNGLSVGLEAYVRVNDVEYFFADAVCEVDGGAVAGKMSVFLLVGDSMQEYDLTLHDVAVMDLIARRFSGDIFLTSNQWKGIDVQISLSATNDVQECEFFVYYGDMEQLRASFLVTEAEPAALPEVPQEGMEEFYEYRK